MSNELHQQSQDERQGLVNQDGVTTSTQSGQPVAPQPVSMADKMLPEMIEEALERAGLM